ncbi:MAG: elongation factor P maturation arginine rhamnosyltransferase EarP [Casimicrobium sp.]
MNVSASQPTPTPSAALTIDLFCRVIDNLGDLGVCWRLARQCVEEHGAQIQLVTDDLSPFAWIAPNLDTSRSEQTVEGVRVVLWSHFEANLGAFRDDASLVIEAFACDPPQQYIERMAARAFKPVWINLEYLTAEDWIDSVHRLPSPHPRLPLLKHFFCPGFSEKSGGLIRERWLNELVTDVPHHEAEGTKLFVFSYPNAPIAALLDGFANAGVTTHTSLACELAQPPGAPHRVQAATRVPQREFDRLLAEHDVLIVRGEDSFVRAQFAGKPMLWHIYQTEDKAHVRKLEAWLNRYCLGLNASTARALRDANAALIGEATGDPSSAFTAFAKALPQLRAHAERWRNALFARPDLASELLSFYQQRVSARLVK